MARRLRLPGTALTALLAVGLGVAFPAGAETTEAWTCWSAATVDDGGQTVSVTRCSLAGSRATADYGSTAEIPVVLHPDVGADGVDVCWYWTTRTTDWVILGVDDERVATLGIDLDGTSGGPIVISATYPACTSEPADLGDPSAEAYRLIRSHIHPAPSPVVSPPTGIAGMDTLVSAVPPPPWTASLVSPYTGATIWVETHAAAIEIVWGDGAVDVVPEAAFDLLSGWPDGAFGHRYETKTCPEPGEPGCHPTLSAYPLTVRFLWSARYRVDGGQWRPIAVPPTSAEIAYDVDEIRAVTTGVG